MTWANLMNSLDQGGEGGFYHAETDGHGGRRVTLTLICLTYADGDTWEAGLKCTSRARSSRRSVLVEAPTRRGALTSLGRIVRPHAKFFGLDAGSAREDAGQ